MNRRPGLQDSIDLVQQMKSYEAKQIIKPPKLKLKKTFLQDQANQIQSFMSLKVRFNSPQEIVKNRLSLGKPLNSMNKLKGLISSKDLARQVRTPTKAKYTYQVKSNLPISIQKFYFVTKAKTKILEYFRKEQLPYSNLFEYLINSYSFLLFKSSSSLKNQPAILREHSKIQKNLKGHNKLLQNANISGQLKNYLVAIFKGQDFSNFLQIYKQLMKLILQDFKKFIQQTDKKNRQVKIKNQVRLILSCCSKINEIFTIPVRDKSFSTNYLNWKQTRFSWFQSNKQFHEDFFDWLQIANSQMILEAALRLQKYS